LTMKPMFILSDMAGFKFYVVFLYMSLSIFVMSSVYTCLSVV